MRRTNIRLPYVLRSLVDGTRLCPYRIESPTSTWVRRRRAPPWREHKAVGRDRGVYAKRLFPPRPPRPLPRLRHGATSVTGGFRSLLRWTLRWSSPPDNRKER